MTSPFGEYSKLVASLVAIATIGAAIAMHGFSLGDSFIDSLALIAIGAIFGANASAAATNGALGRDLKALHERLDTVGLAPSDLSSREPPR